jgi:putative aldouronate transport system permease protein
MFCLYCILPLFLVISVSFSEEADISKYGYLLFPKRLTTIAYEYIFMNPDQIFNAYRTTIMVTVIGTALSLLIISMCGYTLSRSSFRYRRGISFYFFFTMLFGGGLVPSYILITKYLMLKDNFWVLILPCLVNVFNLFLVRTFFQKTPQAIIESAKIDGAKEFRIFFTIVLPISTPVLATVGLFIILQYWNDWWLSLLYIDGTKYVSLQLLLVRMMSNIDFITQNMDSFPSQTGLTKIPDESVRMAMLIVAIAPLLCVFPFIQKYFVTGLTVGSVKG